LVNQVRQPAQIVLKEVTDVDTLDYLLAPAESEPQLDPVGAGQIDVFIIQPI